MAVEVGVAEVLDHGVAGIGKVPACRSSGFHLRQPYDNATLQMLLPYFLLLLLLLLLSSAPPSFNVHSASNRTLCSWWQQQLHDDGQRENELHHPLPNSAHVHELEGMFLATKKN
jgi:hypothetical protein